jgi:hypothetical protein
MDLAKSEDRTEEALDLRVKPILSMDLAKSEDRTEDSFRREDRAFSVPGLCFLSRVRTELG